MTESTRHDLKVGFRLLRREKGTAAIAIAVLAIGICAVATQFSVVQAVFLRGFSFPNAERLVSVQLVDPERSTPFGVNSQIFSLDYQDIREQQTSFDTLAAYLNGSTVNMTIDGRARRFTGAYVTEDFFGSLGVRPILGRDFIPADNVPGAPKVAILGYQLWQRELGGDPGVIGKPVRVNGKAATIVGVMEKGFAFPINEELWIPLFNEYPPLPRTSQRSAGNNVSILATIRPEVSVAAANAEIGAIAMRLAAAYPETNKAYATGLVEPLVKTFSPQQLRGVLYTMLAFCGGVLILACANVMNLQLARATLRARELAIRSSLGATRGRLVRQMLTESGLLAFLGASLGIAGTFWTTRLLMDATHGGQNAIPAFIDFRVDGTVLGFVAAAAIFAALVSGLVPAWAASRASASSVLKDSGRGNSSRLLGVMNRGLVVFQIVVTSILLVGSYFQLESILKQQKIDYGYDTSGVLSARLGLMEGDYPADTDKKAFFDRTLLELRSNGEYAQAALTTRFQMIFSGNGPVEIEGKVYQTAKDRPKASFETVSDGYFDTLGARLLEGRDFNVEDSDQRQPVAIVNAAFAHKHFGTETAIGRRFRTSDDEGQVFGPWRTIVGVVSDLRMLGPFNVPDVDETGFYVPFFANAVGPAADGPVAPQFATVVVRPPAGRRPESLSTVLQADIAKVDANLPLYFIATPAQNLDAILGQVRVIATMFSIFGLVAVALSAAGLYGVMAFSVNQRQQELGTRMVLGADRRKILAMVLSQGFRQLGLGLAIGLGFAFLIAKVGGQGLQRVLFNVDPTSPGAYLAVALLVGVVALVATLVPARRATRVDPVVALRAD